MHVCVGLMASDRLNKMDIIKENRLLTITTDNHQCQTHRFENTSRLALKMCVFVCVCEIDENKPEKWKQ